MYCIRFGIQISYSHDITSNNLKNKNSGWPDVSEPLAGTSLKFDRGVLENEAAWETQEWKTLKMPQHKTYTTTLFQCKLLQKYNKLQPCFSVNHYTTDSDKVRVDCVIQLPNGVQVSIFCYSVMSLNHRPLMTLNTNDTETRHCCRMPYAWECLSQKILLHQDYYSDKFQVLLRYINNRC